MAFVTLLTGNGVLVLASRPFNLQVKPDTTQRSTPDASGSRSMKLGSFANPTAPFFVGLAMALLALAIHWPWLAEPMQWAPLSPLAWGMALFWGALSWPMMLALAKVLQAFSRA